MITEPPLFRLQFQEHKKTYFCLLLNIYSILFQHLLYYIFNSNHLQVGGPMERVKEKFTIKITDRGIVILSGEEKSLHFTAGEALMLLDILK